MLWIKYIVDMCWHQLKPDEAYRHSLKKCIPINSRQGAMSVHCPDQWNSHSRSLSNSTFQAQHIHSGWLVFQTGDHGAIGLQPPLVPRFVQRSLALCTGSGHSTRPSRKLLFCHTLVFLRDFNSPGSSDEAYLFLNSILLMLLVLSVRECIDARGISSSSTRCRLFWE